MNLRRSSGVFVTFVAIAGLLLAPFASAHLDREWTTTADFDAGTKSSPALGDCNYQVEDRTDNGGIPANRIELANMKGDHFDYNCGTGDTWKWDPTAYNAPSPVTRGVSGGVMYLNETRTAGGQPDVTEVGRVSESGVLDVRLKVYEVPTNTATAYAILAIVNEKATVAQGLCGTGASATEDGVYYRVEQGSTNLEAFTCTNNVRTAVGTPTASANPVWLRMVRESTQVRWLYSTNGVTWIQDEMTTFATSSDLYTQFGQFAAGAIGSYANVTYDDYTLESGTPALSGFRSSGEWTSAQTNITSAITSQIVLSHEDLTSDYYISAVSLYSGATLVQTWTSAITSGTLSVLNVTATTTVHYIGGGPAFYWLASVKVELKGVGAATPVLTAVGFVLSVVLPAPPTTSASDAMLFEILLFASFVALFALGLAARQGALILIAGFPAIGLGLYVISQGTDLLHLFLGLVLVGVGALSSVLGGFAAAQS